MDPKQCLNDCSAWIVASFQKRNRGLERLTQNLPRPHSQWWQSWDPISGLKDPIFWPWPTWPHLTCSGAGVSLVTSDTTPTWDLPQQESSHAHPSHPAHCLSILDLVLQAPQETGLPEGTDSAAIPSWQLRQSEHVTGCLVYPSPPVTADPSILRVCNCQTNLHCGFSYTKFCILRKVHKC